MCIGVPAKRGQTQNTTVGTAKKAVNCYLWSAGWVGLSLLFLIWTKRGSGVRWRWGHAGCSCVIPMHAPAPALYRGMMPLTPVPTASSLITPLPPPLSPEHDGSNWGQDTSQPGALWAGSDRYDNPHCPKCRHDATTCPWVRGPPLELQPAFFIGEFRTTCLPLSRVTNAKVEHRPTCHRGYYHR